MNTISFMSANFVARELNYNMTRGWMEGDAAAQAYFRPAETFSPRFDAMLSEVSRLGFNAIDIWTAQLSPDWASEAQISEARRLLTTHGLTVPSLAVHVPGDLAGMEKICRFAHSLGAKVLGGGCHPEALATLRTDFIRLLEEYDLVFGYENHPEKSLAEVLEKIGPEDSSRIGIALDTGWFATQGYDAVKAVRRLSSRIVLIHLKDIHRPEKSPDPTLKDMGHETCALGEGVVPVGQCVAELKTAGYPGNFSIEHEPEDHNPLPEVKTSLERLQSWLKN